MSSQATTVCAKDYFNSQQHPLWTYDRAEEVIKKMSPRNLAKFPDKRVVYLFSQTGFLQVKVDGGHEGQEVKLDHDEPLSQYGPVRLEDFVETRRLAPETMAFFPMDFHCRDVLRSNGNFDVGYLGSFMGVDKRLTQPAS